MSKSKKTPKGRDAADEPYVENYLPLVEWLKKVGARCMWQAPVGDRKEPTAYIECYLINGRVALVQVHANRNGWNIYTAGMSGRVDATIKDAEARLGIGPALEGCKEV